MTLCSQNYTKLHTVWQENVVHQKYTQGHAITPVGIAYAEYLARN